MGKIKDFKAAFETKSIEVKGFPTDEDVEALFNGDTISRAGYQIPIPESVFEDFNSLRGSPPQIVQALRKMHKRSWHSIPNLLYFTNREGFPDEYQKWLLQKYPSSGIVLPDK